MRQLGIGQAGQLAGARDFALQERALAHSRDQARPPGRGRDIGLVAGTRFEQTLVVDYRNLG